MTNATDPRHLDKMNESMLIVLSFLLLSTADNATGTLNEIFQLPVAMKSLDVLESGACGRGLIDNPKRLRRETNCSPPDKENWELSSVGQTMNQRNDHIRIICKEFR